MKWRALVSAGLCATCAFAGNAAAVSRPAAAAAPVVVAVIGEGGGVNVLHQDFRTSDGRNPNYPAGMPRPVMIGLPAGGSFDSRWARLAAGPLSRLRPHVVYGIAGTRLLLVNTGAGPYNATQGDLIHATGVADSVTGTRFGTDPQALVVLTFSNGPVYDAYRWLDTASSWVDLASTSDYTIQTLNDPTQCGGASDVRAFTAAGHEFFSSAGNTTDQPEPLVSPNGLPETYLVGGVDAAGNSWRPGHPEEADPFYEFGNVVRPYETGELFSYTAAGPGGVNATQHFGGTSGATPRTAGWAATLIAHARAVLGARGTVAGTLAAGPHRTRQGPLADGRFTRGELVSLLHSVAVPHSGLPDGAQYAAEGFGALNAAAIKQAVRILDGLEAEPSRPGDRQAYAASVSLRSALFARC